MTDSVAKLTENEVTEEISAVVVQESYENTAEDLPAGTYVFAFFGIIGWILIFLLLKWVFRREYWQN